MDVWKSTDRAIKAGPSEYFTGTVYQNPIVQTPEPARVRAINVTFMPGARTNWHTHPLGQTLYVTAGVGRVQLEGEPVQEIRPGDAVYIHPGERHWHGAAPDQFMTHVAIAEADENGTHIEWLEAVSDEDANAAPG